MILDVNTLGGRVDAALQIIDAIGAANVPVYAFVDPRAISAGALISISTDSVFMTADATLGASTVVDAQGSKVSEKAQSVMRAQFRALAERRGLDPRIGEAMVDETIAIDGRRRGGQAPHADRRRGGAGRVRDRSDRVRRPAGTPRDRRRGDRAAEPQLGRGTRAVPVAPDRRAASCSRSACWGSSSRSRPRPSVSPAWWDSASLGAFFGSHLIIGLAGWEEVILLGAGLIALGIEVFVVPGFGIAGVISILCVGSAVFMALIGSLPTWADVARASGVLASSLGIIGAAVYLVVRNLPTSDRWRGIFLRTASAADEGYVSGDVRDDLIGRIGVALTDLHPGGTVQLDGERLDVVTEGDFVNRGARVRVVRAEGYRLVVAAVDEPGLNG